MEKWICIALCAFVFAATLNSFAPDKTAQRIEACMIQDGMQYTHLDGCIPIKEND